LHENERTSACAPPVSEEDGDDEENRRRAALLAPTRANVLNPPSAVARAALMSR
jgi:hypothetical protein